ncbi:MAG: rhodanese-like domain-containing protein [Sphingomonadales bacterium]
MAHYAGDIGPLEAWRILEADSHSVLIDVRTDAEWSFVGVPDLSPVGRQPLLLSWQVFPSMARNPEFEAALAGAAPDPARPMLFLCRSGARSAAAAAAMTAAGYSHCYNIAGGFEGDRDATGHRGTVNGWKVDGLPWIQG